MAKIVGGLRFLSVLTVARAFSSSSSTYLFSQSATRNIATTSLNMARPRGLEKNREGATPEVGGMTLFLKAAEDGVSVGDCPFAHAVRLVLEEKGLEYQVQPCTAETKPEWLVEVYEGKMPALRHRKECYVDSSVICEYLEFFFPEPVSLKPPKMDDSILDGFFPAVAQYLKDTSDDPEKLSNLQGKLKGLDDHLSSGGPFLCGESFSMLDCRLVPQLYHLKAASAAYKGSMPKLEEEYPHLAKYYEATTSRPSFSNTVYPEETVVWGWGNARS